MNPVTSICGLKVIENPNLVHWTRVKRTWRERLRSKPWIAYKEVGTPDPDVYPSRTFGVIIGHPETLRKLLNVVGGDR